MTEVTVVPDELSSIVGIEDMAKLSGEQKKDYYVRVCKSLGLNPLTKPLNYLQLGGRMILYALKDATDQLRRIHEISLSVISREVINGVYIVTARATMPGGRSDESTGAVFVDGLKGEMLANAYMKSETKAKRRVTLSIVGLGWLDETEVSAIPDARRVNIDTETGEIRPSPISPFGDGQRATGIPQGEESKERAEAQPQAVKLQRPYLPEMVIKGVQSRTGKGKQELAGEGKRGATVGAMETLFADKPPLERRILRHTLLNAFFGEDSSKGMTEGQCDAILAWCQETITEEEGRKTYVPDEHAIIEAQRIIEMVETSRHSPSATPEGVRDN